MDTGGNVSVEYFLFTIALIVIAVIGLILYRLVKKVWGLKGFLLVIILWLIPSYLLACVVAGSVPSKYDQAFGNLLLGFLFGLGWFILFPIVIAVISNIKWRKRIKN